MLMIRLARFGAKKRPFYRVVLIEKESPRDGRALEVLGNYSPTAKPAQVVLKHDRISYWKSKGAQMSDTVERLVKTNAAAEPVPAV
jgi:small subunit ribosomal protein S16